MKKVFCLLLGVFLIVGMIAISKPQVDLDLEIPNFPIHNIDHITLTYSVRSFSPFPINYSSLSINDFSFFMSGLPAAFFDFRVEKIKTSQNLGDIFVTPPAGPGFPANPQAIRKIQQDGFLNITYEARNTLGRTGKAKKYILLD